MINRSCQQRMIKYSQFMKELNHLHIPAIEWKQNARSFTSFIFFFSKTTSKVMLMHILNSLWKNISMYVKLVPNFTHFEIFFKVRWFGPQI